MLFVYPAIVHPEGNSFWVEFPNLPGCQTYGNTLNETIGFAQEALAGYILTLLEEGKELPTPSGIETLSSEKNTFTTLVACELQPYKDTKAIKKTLTIPAWLNERATAMGINFSQVLQEALISKITSSTGSK